MELGCSFQNITKDTQVEGCGDSKKENPFQKDS